ncbi:sigma-54-dependent Fis family transcriptional regulator [Paraneptunicella aestuarii]|uniref:sigma-54-dependent transcriptional regulator n=1 Tax=Paraneptunicella aestuarii TaxID=2831148 RepID=UPI001E2FC917|nr:sigma-54 dependent transcriptional regulator [Paraneptunicella aestuarii]UAA39981.1 sigma-54-dependent Fis family transcriptional regulator [Paraneptunicella aestuarii]
MSQPHILVVDDRQEIRVSARFVLEDNGYQVSEAENPEVAKAFLKQDKPALMLLDMNFTRDTTSGEEGLAFLSWLEKEGYDIPTVVMTAWSNVSLAVEAMQRGAGDFLEKPWKNQRLLHIIQQQLTLNGLKRQNEQLKQRLEPVTESDFEWRSECMTRLYQQVERIAASDVPILLTGENGTGKTRMAQYIHKLSARSDNPFISVNMGGITETLFESEMFGHMKGAFTDAKNNRIGRFELAKQGTLFLDEIANIPLSQQMKLLRVLESGEYEVLGSSATQYADVRIISATNADIQSMIAQREFREDLFFRLNTMEFRMPSLRERQEDIVPLANFFIAQFSSKYQMDTVKLGLTAQHALRTYHWPGNIRELSHIMERALLLNAGEEVDAADLHIANTSLSGVATGGAAMSDENGVPVLPMMTLEDAEKQLIRQALDITEQNIPKAAELLGLTKSSLYRRLEKYADLQVQ